MGRRVTSGRCAATVQHLDLFAVGIKAQARHRCARGGMGEGVATIAVFGAHGALREGEALDAPDDRVGHAAITITRMMLARRHGGDTAV